MEGCASDLSCWGLGTPDSLKIPIPSCLCVTQGKHVKFIQSLQHTNRKITMATIAFDTLKDSKRLKDAGVPDKQAEAEALAEVL